MKPRLLDLFCGAGGSSMGYYRAGFEVEGVDNRPQPHYPFKFYQADALEFPLEGYDAYHASPPCQAYSKITAVAYRENHPDLIDSTRQALLSTGKPYVIENVECARHLLINPIMLCGSMFGLQIWRHRWFEIYPETFFLQTPCSHIGHPVLVTGTPKRKGVRIKEPTTAEIRVALTTDWMTKKEMDEAIPPAYTEYIGKQLLKCLTVQ